MATDPTLTVVLSPVAENELWEIWQYNFERYGFEHAEDYGSFLNRGINALARVYGDGRHVEGLPELRYMTLKRGRRGDGHYVIYEVDQLQGAVHVHHIFHTKMNVVQRLKEEAE